MNQQQINQIIEETIKPFYTPLFQLAESWDYGKELLHEDIKKIINKPDLTDSEYYRIILRLKDHLLYKHRKLLTSVYGLGYKVCVPAEQSVDQVLKKAQEGNRKYAKAVDISEYTDVTGLNDKELSRAKITQNHIKKISSFNQQENSSIGLALISEGKSLITEINSQDRNVITKNTKKEENNEKVTNNNTGK
jgi:hypothetical protein